MIQQQNIQAQGEANAKQAEAAALAEVEKQDALNRSEAELEEVKSQLDVRKMMREANIKKELMAYEFQLNAKLREAEAGVSVNKEMVKEDRKDQRVDKEAEHKYKLQEQKSKGDSLKTFESSGNDILTGGANMERFGL